MTYYQWYSAIKVARHHFSKLLDFSLVKLNFPHQTRNVRCRSSFSPNLKGIFLTHFLRLLSFQEIFVLHWGKTLLDHSEPRYIFQPSIVLNHPYQIISIFPDFPSKCQFSTTKKLLNFLTFLTCSNPGSACCSNTISKVETIMQQHFET